MKENLQKLSDELEVAFAYEGREAQVYPVFSPDTEEWHLDVKVAGKPVGDNQYYPAYEEELAWFPSSWDGDFSEVRVEGRDGWSTTLKGDITTKKGRSELIKQMWPYVYGSELKMNPDKDELIKSYRYWLDVFQYASTDDEFEKAQEQLDYMARKYPHLREEFEKADPQSWDTLENPKKDRMYLFHIAHRGTAYFGLGPNPRIAKRKLTQQLKGTGLTAESPNVQGYDIDYNTIAGEGWNSKI